MRIKHLALLAPIAVLASCAANQPVTRTGIVAARGNPLTLEGTSRGVKVGEHAPDFTAVANDMSESSLSEFRGKTVILATVPSLDTGVCDKETREFNARALGLSEGIVVLTVSMDLPMAQKRWCGAAGVERVVTLSDSKRREVGDRYGLRIRENGLLARSVTVIDPAGVVRYQQIVPEVTSEPDYDSAINAAIDATR